MNATIRYQFYSYFTPHFNVIWALYWNGSQNGRPMKNAPPPSENEDHKRDLYFSANLISRFIKACFHVHISHVVLTGEVLETVLKFIFSITLRRKFIWRCREVIVSSDFEAITINEAPQSDPRFRTEPFIDIKQRFVLIISARFLYRGSVSAKVWCRNQSSTNLVSYSGNKRS